MKLKWENWQAAAHMDEPARLAMVETVVESAKADAPRKIHCCRSGDALIVAWKDERGTVTVVDAKPLREATVRK